MSATTALICKFADITCERFRKATMDFSFDYLSFKERLRWLAYRCLPCWGISPLRGQSHPQVLSLRMLWDIWSLSRTREMFGIRCSDAVAAIGTTLRRWWTWPRPCSRPSGWSVGFRILQRSSHNGTYFQYFAKDSVFCKAYFVSFCPLLSSLLLLWHIRQFMASSFQMSWWCCSGTAQLAANLMQEEVLTREASLVYYYKVMGIYPQRKPIKRRARWKG